MAAEGLRRSTRVRKPVKSYAEEQAEEGEVASNAPPPKRKKIQAAIDEEYDRNDNATLQDLPKKKAKSSTQLKTPKTEDETLIAGWTKNGRSIFVADPHSLPQRKSKENNDWFADAAERRIIATAKTVSSLAPGEQEKRLRPHVTTPTESYHSALEKATKQRMFVLDRERGVEEACHAHHVDCPCETLQVAGSTGNVYRVRISHTPSCTCPAGIFMRKGEEKLCKHILYVLHYVLKAPDELKRQNAFLTAELKALFANAPALPDQVVADGEGFDGRRKPVEDDCPICCMEFEDGEEVVWCRAACGNNIHQACFGQWAKTKAGNVTCPFCRTLWEAEVPKTQKFDVAKVDMSVERGAGGYRNVRDQLDYGGKA